MATQQQIKLGNFLTPLTDLACKMILAGTLKKNVIKHFTNRGLPFETSENIVECGVIKAENFMKCKAK
jgi:hypothetical protein